MPVLAIVGRMDVLGTVLNVVLVAATLIVVVFAGQTVRESRKATKAAQDTVDTVRDLLGVARETSASSAAAVEAARETVELARSARAADERYRLLQQLREAGSLVQVCLTRARLAHGQDPGRGQPTWRCAEQTLLGQVLTGVNPPMPKCHALAVARGLSLVLEAANAADAELTQVLSDVLGVPPATPW